MSRYTRTPVAALAIVLASACAPQAPPCKDTSSSSAPSAGCFVATARGLLVVEHPGGKISMPGGKVEAGESARCAAIRETWEETGAEVTAGELLQVFPSGFELYACALAGEHLRLGTHMPQEVADAYFLPREQFGGADWRFPSDLPAFELLFDEVSSGSGAAAPPAE